MAKPRKKGVRAEQKKALPTNIAATIIITEEQERVSLPGVRRTAGEVGRKEIVTIRNKVNGAVNKMATAHAIKLVTKDADTYELLK